MTKKTRPKKYFTNKSNRTRHNFFIFKNPDPATSIKKRQEKADSKSGKASKSSKEDSLSNVRDYWITKWSYRTSHRGSVPGGVQTQSQSRLMLSSPSTTSRNDHWVLRQLEPQYPVWGSASSLINHRADYVWFNFLIYYIHKFKSFSTGVLGPPYHWEALIIALVNQSGVRFLK